jgi:hypothetical protein
MRRGSFLPRVRDQIVEVQDPGWFLHYCCQDYAFSFSSPNGQQGLRSQRCGEQPSTVGDLIDFSC